MRSLPGRHLHPSSRPRLPAQAAVHQQRSGDDEGEIGDECRICMNSKVSFLSAGC